MLRLRHHSKLFLIFANLGIALGLAPSASAGEDRLHGSLTLSPGLQSYQQTGKARVQDLNLTGKVSFGYDLKPKRLGFDATLFRTLTSLNHSPTGTTPLTFTGLNLRLPITLTNAQSSTRIFVAPGYYGWKGVASGANYGLNSVTGPQIQLGIQSKKLGVALKFAPLATKFQNDREYAVSLSLRINAKDSKTRTDLVFDYADLKLQFNNGIDTFSSHSYTFGIRFGR